MTDYSVSERRIVNGRELCPECVTHEQGNPREVEDCKNLFWGIVDRKMQVRGQCCCFSEVHGKREG